MTPFYTPLEYDHKDKYDDQPRTDLLEFLPEKFETVLEIGCGNGATGALIKEKYPGLTYVGLEIDVGAARMAEKRLDAVISGDVEKMTAEQLAFSKESFDLIIAADVLEHLYDPWRAMGFIRYFNQIRGKILITVPNTQYINVIANLVHGHWTYEKYGLMDATHIRFFTWTEIEKLLKGAGYRILQTASKLPFNLDDQQWPQDITVGDLIIKNVDKIHALKLYTYQYVILAEKEMSEA